LLDRPQIIAANKMDMPGAEDNLGQFKKKLSDNTQIFSIFALTRDGLRDLLFAIADTLDKIPKHTPEPEEDSKKEVIYRYKQEGPPFTISRDDDGAYVLSGNKIEKLFKMTDFTKDESAQRFARQLRGMGVNEALRKRGATDGDTIRLLEFEFEFIE